MLTVKGKLAALLLGLGVFTAGGAALDGQRPAAPANAPGAAAPRQDNADRPVAAEEAAPQAERDYAVAEFYRRTDRPGSARFYYELVLRRYPATSWADRARGRLRELGQQPAGAKEEKIPAPRPEAALAAARVLATVNGVAILAEEVDAAAYLALAQAPDLSRAEVARALAARRAKTLDRLIERELVMQQALAKLSKGGAPGAAAKLRAMAAKEFERQWAQVARKRAGLRDEEALRAALRKQGMALEALRRQWQRDFIAQEYLRSSTFRPGPGPVDARLVQREQERVVAELKRRAVIEYADGR
jgi:hypothetical protein